MYENDGIDHKELLASELTGLLGHTVAFKFLAHGFHWNVKGHDFNEFHKFFRKIYEEAEENIDTVAELIRQLDYDAPFMLTDFAALSGITGVNAGDDPISMCEALLEVNNGYIEHVKNIFDIATDCREQGIANTMADFQSAYSLLGWKLRATLNQNKQPMASKEMEGMDTDGMVPPVEDMMVAEDEQYLN